MMDKLDLLMTIILGIFWVVIPIAILVTLVAYL